MNKRYSGKISKSGFLQPSQKRISALQVFGTGKNDVVVKVYDAKDMTQKNDETFIGEYGFTADSGKKHDRINFLEPLPVQNGLYIEMGENNWATIEWAKD
jgi:hypothetical protein